jgi:hypothetical protein
VLYALDLAVPDNMEGRVLSEALDPAVVAARPLQREPALAGPEASSEGAYSAEEQTDIAGRLAALGYIE